MYLCQKLTNFFLKKYTIYFNNVIINYIKNYYMNRNEQQDAKLINVRGSDVICLLKTKEDRKNFAMEMSKNITI